MPSGKPHYRLSFSDAIEAHEQGLAVSGGLSGILNEHGIHSAIARPYSGYFRSIHDKGSALLEAVVQNHGFIDGNKRTAVILLLLLITRSGFELRAASEDRDLDLSLEDLVVDLAAGGINREVVKIWLKARCYRVQPLHSPPHPL